MMSIVIMIILFDDDKDDSDYDVGSGYDHSDDHSDDGYIELLLFISMSNLLFVSLLLTFF